MKPGTTRHTFSVITALVLGLVFVPPFSGTTAHAAPTADRADNLEVHAKDQFIESLMIVISGSTKPLPVWAVDIAMRAYDIWKTYENGQKVNEVQREVLSVLQLVVRIKDQVEMGQEMSEREYWLTRELLDAHVRRLDDHARRIRALQTLMEDLERRFQRRGCGVAHAWRNQRCVDVRLQPALQQGGRQ
jgi:hypothetical protein